MHDLNNFIEKQLKQVMVRYAVPGVSYVHRLEYACQVCQRVLITQAIGSTKNCRPVITAYAVWVFVCVEGRTVTVSC